MIPPQCTSPSSSVTLDYNISCFLSPTFCVIRSTSSNSHLCSSLRIRLTVIDDWRMGNKFASHQRGHLQNVPALSTCFTVFHFNCFLGGGIVLPRVQPSKFIPMKFIDGCIRGRSYDVLTFVISEKWLEIGVPPVWVGEPIIFHRLYSQGESQSVSHGDVGNL